MKRQPWPRHAAYLTLIVVMVAALMGASCPKGRASYNSIKAATVGVQTAIRVAGIEAQTNPAVAAQRDEIERRYKQFQAFALMATDVAQGMSDKQAAIDIVSKAATDLIDFINSFLPPEKKMVPL